MLYGYKMDHGDIVIHKEEEIVVHRVLTEYLAGLSYQKLSDGLNADHIPYCQEAPEWNKHKVKRMLEQPSDGLSAVALILQGTSARYDCCESSVLPHERDNTAGVVDWGRFAKIVSHITVEPDQTITLHF